MRTLPPILVIDSITLGDERVSAQLRIGPRKEEIKLGFYLKDIEPYFISIEKMPKPLPEIYRAQNAVIRVLQRAYHGEAVHLPLDLSHVVRGAEAGNWPLSPTSEARAAHPSIEVAVTRVRRSRPRRGMVSIELTIDGLPSLVIVHPNGGWNRSTNFRFVSGVHPWQLTDAEAWVMVNALVRAIPASLR